MYFDKKMFRKHFSVMLNKLCENFIKTSGKLRKNKRENYGETIIVD